MALDTGVSTYHVPRNNGPMVPLTAPMMTNVVLDSTEFFLYNKFSLTMF